MQEISYYQLQLLLFLFRTHQLENNQLPLMAGGQCNVNAKALKVLTHEFEKKSCITKSF